MINTLKKYSIVLFVIGFLVLGVSFFIFAKNTAYANSVKEYDAEATQNGDVIFVRGVIGGTEGSQDSSTGVKSSKPILIKNVEMVQWIKDNDGVRKVFANYKIDSFEDNGKKYTNPDFPKGLNNELIYGKVTTGKRRIQLSREVLNYLVNESGFIKEDMFSQKTDLLEPADDKYNLISTGDYLISASDDWEVGEVRISYYELDTSKLDRFTFIGKLSSSEGQDIMVGLDKGPIVKEGDLTVEQVKKLLSGDMRLCVAGFSLGIVLLVLGFGLERTKKIDKMQS